VDVHSTYSASLSTIQATRATASRTVQNKQKTEISEQDLQQLRQLKSRDLLVRAHEAAHLAAASGIVVGGASYSYQRGPDGEWTVIVIGNSVCSSSAIFHGEYLCIVFWNNSLVSK
jgi:hypothetical protein